MRRGIYAVLTSLLIVGPVTAADDDAFLVDKKQFKKQVRTIALTPVDADGYFEMPDRVAAMLEAEVTRRLEKEGFDVIPSSVLAGIRRTMEQQVGGITDPDTGEMDIDRAQAVRTHSFRELWFREDFDALGNIRVSISRVSLENDRVEWDGTEQKIEYEGRGKKYAAKIYVSSVGVGIYDATLTPLYLNYGGLEPLMYRAGEQLETLATDQLFRDEKKIREAVKIAVDPF
ncbi:MAG: hypothetical protein HKN58_09895 [Xanthomonadales bacterium]|nr:hypothetical protein [Xanthomonadales bacterium]